MKEDVKAVAALPNHFLHIELADGRVGLFDMGPHLGQPGLEALRSPAYFAKVRVLFGAPTWPDGEDVSPFTISAGIQLTASA